MKRFIISSLTTTLVLAGTLGAATVNQRRENQQDRIAQGVRSGQLTARETANLEHKEARLNARVRDDREDHNGHLTARERANVNRTENHLSRDIYRDKHNGARQ
jgi:hypothetical protein